MFFFSLLLQVKTHKTNVDMIEFCKKYGFTEKDEEVFCDVYPLKFTLITFYKKLNSEDLSKCEKSDIPRSI